MNFHLTDKKRPALYQMLPWLHFAGAFCVVVTQALFSAVHSPLGREISAGESPGFSWIRANITTCTVIALGYLITVGWLQIRWRRHFSSIANRWLLVLILLETLGVIAVGMLIVLEKVDYLLTTSSVVVISVLAQGIIAYRFFGRHDIERRSALIQHSSAQTTIFLLLLFIFGVAVSFIEPSWRRTIGQIVLDSEIDSLLWYVFPSILSGTINVWFGIGMLIIVNGLNRFFKRLNVAREYRWLVYFLVFFSLVAVFTAFIFVTIYYTIAWQINNLLLRTSIWLLIIFFGVFGGILFTSVFFRLITHDPRQRLISVVGVVSLTLGAAVIFPLTWVLTRRFNNKTTWIPLSVAVLSACIGIGYPMLFGGIFNPWFTSLSYLKGAILLILSVIGAGTTVLVIEQVFPMKASAPFRFRRQGIALAVTTVLGFLPFYSLANNPEVKVAVLQSNELARVNTTFAREFANVVGLEKWIRLGQRPPQNQNPHPWPHPWELKKVRASLLPADFNLLIIVADALRGDAFRSAGYQRDLTPFLDRWAREEAISFRRAYSQGGGSFAAFPFLVAGRSRLGLYGPGLHRENMYFKLAQAEGIQHYMLMKGFGPRHLYPPDLPVTELVIPRAVSDRHSATADEVFDAARNAIGALPAGERFLCFLQLMDVHNDLWKKKGGRDFGDSPRDLYDNNLSYLDRAFAQFVGWLKIKGVYDRTVIFFTADHGEQFWEHGASLHGHTVYEEEIRIPLILVNHVNRERFESVPVIAADIVPTIVEMAGYTVDPPYDDPRMGISLVPLLLGKEKQRYFERDVVGRASFKRRYFMYRNWEWKLVYFAELDLVQLFNVVKDPDEKTNLLTEESALAVELEQELFEYLETVEGKTYRSTF